MKRASFILRCGGGHSNVRAMKPWFLLVLALATGLGRAADARLRPAAATAVTGSSIQLSLTRGDGFDTAEEPVAIDEVERARVMLAGEPAKVVDPVADGNTLRLTLPLPRAGVAVAGVELKPALREIAADDVERALRALHAGDALRAEWEALPTPRRWREQRRENAKTFVRVGDVADATWAQPLGFGLELLPLNDPTALRAGADLAVRLLFGGRPLVGAVVVFVSAEAEREHVVITDEEGRATATLDVRGAWLVRAAELRRAAAPELTWERDVTSLVVETR